MTLHGTKLNFAHSLHGKVTEIKRGCQNLLESLALVNFWEKIKSVLFGD